MLTLEDVKSYKIPGLPPLKEHQMKFLVDVLNGVDITESYKRHYLPVTKSKVNKCKLTDLASGVTAHKWFNKYKQAFEEIVKTRQEDEIGWTLDMSIKERRKLYSLNLIEVDRLARAYDKEIEYYTRKKQEAIEECDEEKIDYYEQKIIRASKSKNMSIASNNACMQALDGLDKLKGLHTVNVNHTGGVNFFGDDMWEGEDDGTDEGQSC